MVTAIRNQTPVDSDRGLVEARAGGCEPARRARSWSDLTSIAAPPRRLPPPPGKSYVVQNGDSVWRIANRFKVSQEALMKANGISDAKKMKVGMSLVIPN